jgi:glutamyl-tRNA reductase
MTGTGVISGVSVSHSDATVAEIEAAGGADAVADVTRLLETAGVQEAFAIQTCNRAEAYVVTEAPGAGRAALRGFAPDVRDAAVTELDHEESIRHLMRVAAGLDSLVVGEDQILGQFRRAVDAARNEGGVGPVLDEALTKALHVGERVRAETAINEGVVSLGSAAVELAGRHADLAGATAVVVGAGEMGRLAAQALASADVERVVVANRTLPHAEHIANTIDADGRAVGLDALAAAAREADVLITATASPEPVLDRSDLADAGETVVVDVAQPRDVASAVDELAPVAAYDLDDLEAVTDETRERRRREAETAEAMIDEEFTHLMETFKRKQADDAIGAMYAGAERVKQRELDRALNNLEANGGLTDAQRDTVEALADSLIGQLLAAPTRSLRDAAAEDDWTTIHTAMQLFDPEFDAATDRGTGADIEDMRATAGDGRDDEDGYESESEDRGDSEGEGVDPKTRAVASQVLPDDVDVLADVDNPQEWAEGASDD